METTHYLKFAEVVDGPVCCGKPVSKDSKKTWETSEVTCGACKRTEAYRIAIPWQPILGT